MTTAATDRRQDTRQSSEAVPQIPAGIRLVGSELRSTNLERDVRDETLNSPYLGARALDVLERVTHAVTDLKRTRAWSFTGPYGSGKSTLSNVIDAVLGHDPHRAAEAEAAVATASHGLATQLVRARDELAPKGFLGAVATARREPLAATVWRALQTAVVRRWKQRLPKAVAQAVAACSEREIPTTGDLLDAVTALCHEAPLLLIIDEFGKTLEYLAAEGDSGSADSDVFLLQMLAEKGAGRSGLPLFLFTLQHLAFTDYAARSSTIQTQEWAKVQGRFEDITFTPHLGDAVHLLQRRLDHSAVAATGRELIDSQAEASAQAWRAQGLTSAVDISADLFADLYPLHPLTAVAAPLLASQIGQHDRSLTGFLASDEPNTVRRCLDAFSAENPQCASTVRLPQLYDYFFASGRTTILASTNASRWLEVDARLQQAHGLPAEDQDVLKTIGILNLIDVDGVLRATPAMIQFALHDPIDASDPERFEAVQQRLNKLEDGGFVVHREYSNEYRVWQGTDVDIDDRVKENATRIDRTDVVDYFKKHLGTVLPVAVVAGGHSQRTGMLRYFDAAISHDTDKLDGPSVVEDAADGLIVYHLGTLDTRPRVNSPLPVLIGVTENPTRVLQAGITLAALKELLDDANLDHVAVREIEQRVADISQSIAALLDEAFSPQGAHSTWYLWKNGNETHAEPDTTIEARSYASLVSKACDQAYPFTPLVRNEMVGRHQLSSNAARARRVLLSAMLQRSGEYLLGYDKNRYTPERALYHGVVEYLGLHRAAGDVDIDTQPDAVVTHGLSRPTPEHNDTVLAAWQALENALTAAKKPVPIADLYHQLMAPPFGVKAGVVPILVVAALLLRTEDIALFEEGNYCPRLTPEIIERLESSYPDRFTVKAAPTGPGQREIVVQRLAADLAAEGHRRAGARNPQLLAVTRAMLDRVRTLERYAWNTRQLSPEALAVRDALSHATDPDELVFSGLPRALGLKPIGINAPKNEKAANSYASRLAAALDELYNADAALRQRVAAAIGGEFGLPADPAALRSGLTQRLRGFADAPLEPQLRGFISRVLNTDLSDDDWLDPIVIRLSNKALGDWTDRDTENFPRRVKEIARALDRVGHLYDADEPPVPDTKAPTPRPIDTHLLTLTGPQGREVRALIHVPHHYRQAADELVVGVIKQAEQALGPNGARVLLAALAEHLTAEDTTAARKETL